MIKHHSPVSGIDSFKDKFVATAGYDNRLILWDYSTKTPIARGYHDHLVNSCRFSNCGNFLISAGSDHLARLWEVPSMKLLAVFGDHQDDVEDVVISSDNKYVATASRDSNVRLFTSDGILVRKFIGHEMDVISLEFGEDESGLISSGDDGTVRIWDINTGLEKSRMEMGDIETDTICINGKLIYAGDDTGTVSVIEGQQVTHRFAAHKAGIKNITYDRHSNLIMSCSYDYNIILWRPDEDKGLIQIEKIECPMEVWLRAATIVNEQTLAFGTFGSSYCTYNVVTKQWDLSGITPTPGLNAVSSFLNKTFSVGDEGAVYIDGERSIELGSLCNFLLPFDRCILSGGQAGIVFDAVTGEHLYKHSSPLNCGATFSANGRKMAIIGTYTGEGIILESVNGKVSFIKIIQLDDNAIKGIAANDNYIFSVCATGSCAFYDTANLNLIKKVDDAHEKIANGASASENGTFVSVSRDLKLRIWNTITFTAEKIVAPQNHSLKCVAVGGERSNYVAIGSYNGYVSVYDLTQKKWLNNIRYTGSGISSAYYDDNSGKFIFSSYDGQIYELSTKSMKPINENGKQIANSRNLVA